MDTYLDLATSIITSPNNLVFFMDMMNFHET